MLLMWMALVILPLANAQDETVDFSSAVVQEASVRPELVLGNVPNPVPLPHNVEGIPNYESILRLAAAMPAIQVTTGEPSINDIKSDIIPPAKSNDADNEESSAKRQNVLRILVVGDSMTHCHEGDFTWRYRLLEWFNAQNISIRYVGPYNGTIAPPAPGPPEKPALYGSSPTATQANTDGGYNIAIEPETDLKHFAISGRAAATDQFLIEQVAKDYPADLMLIKLGFNDLGWFYTDDKGLLNNMRNLVNNARLANPNMRFVVATVVHRTFLAGRQDLVTLTDSYNRMLKAQIGEWSTPSSPVTWAPVREEYDCGPQYSGNCPAAYDGLHPNELGDFQIARGFSRALVSALGIGKTPLEVPGNIPTRALPTPDNFRMSSSDLGVTATWDKVYGAYSYDVEYKISGGAPNNNSPGSVESNRWDSKWAVDGWTYEIRVRASAGNRKGAWTAWYSATAHPHTATAPSNVSVHPTANGIDVSWTASTGSYANTVSQYNIYFWDQDEPCSFPQSGGFLPGKAASIVGLVPDHRYIIAIEAWNAAGAGFPLSARSAVPGQGQPSTVTGLQVGTLDPTNAHLTWTSLPGAAGYRYWRRNFNQTSNQLESLGQLDETCIDVHLELPGTWNYEWAISAYNGEIEGPLSPAVKAPPQNSTNVAGTCPAPPALCPAGTTATGGAPSTDPINPNDPPPVGGGQPS
ncbi:uncharacterized protein RCO7_11539 [Rhynchosporium graminicola]|uniref:Fibronectin type-III domain-containing protein n=1 Tax=Rhynchosporium graminicola TaxID=2792576 RepID=A0A1E1LLI8_9HELO|nr:uncharacterized protein RCO7_11539 [Rhynchosporium commune]